MLIYQLENGYNCFVLPVAKGFTVLIFDGETFLLENVVQTMDEVNQALDNLASLV